MIRVYVDQEVLARWLAPKAVIFLVVAVSFAILARQVPAGVFALGLVGLISAVLWIADRQKRIRRYKRSAGVY